MDEEIKSAGETARALGELIKAAGDSPQAKEAAQNLGQTAVTVTRAINTVLLPIAAVNFAFERARAYFSGGHFQRDLVDRTKDIPLEAVVEPKPSIAAPLLQGLAFSHEEAPLKVMYLDLLSTAMDGRAADPVHPAYVEVLKQLTAYEAESLVWLIGFGLPHEIVQIRSRRSGTGGWRIERNHVMNVQVSLSDPTPDTSPQWEAAIENYQRLGLVDVGYGTFLEAPSAYQWVETRPEYLDAVTRHSTASPQVEVFFERGHVSPTAFGKRFAKAAGLTSAAHEQAAERRKVKSPL